MSTKPAGSRAEAAALILSATSQRLTAAATAVAPGRTPDEAGSTLSFLLARARVEPGVIWLTLVASQGRFPTDADVLELRRRLATRNDGEVAAWLLGRTVSDRRLGHLTMEMDVVTDGVVVGVDFCARHDIHTGIHRVVRETLPRWLARSELVAAANVDAYDALRTLAPREHHRVFAFGTPLDVDPHEERAYRARLVVPWRSTLVLPEIPEPRFAPSLASFAQHSGNRLTLVGYDMIPVVSADLRPPEDAVRFGHYLAAVKHAHAVAAISMSATVEFSGFAHAVTAQGLPGPRVVEVVLPADVPPAASTPPAPGRPRVLCVGSHEPHKNHLAVLHAAERLWREGLDFELQLIGGAGWRRDDFTDLLARIARSGRPVTNRGRVSDDELWTAFREATFSVFLSLHEGFGLPVVESLGCGTPVLTSAFGSMAEIADDGGCVTVDPMDDDAVADAMRVLLTDPDHLAALRAAAAARPRRTWDEYAAEAWSVLVAGDQGPDATTRRRLQ
ncbi:MAG: glycosyltransferase family 4 protein [Cellulomonadaceae bacterium]|nr:glycosyltransferase family 4 protein [Cellulomonadaceae bacterium]